MPTISSSRVQPLVTPSTALFTSARVSPCSAACESFSRSATIWPSCCSTRITRGITVSIFPFGPCTATVLPSTLKVTPLGSAIGFFPIRDIKQLLAFSLLAQLSCERRALSSLLLIAHGSMLFLPNLAQHFATDALLARLASGHNSTRRGQNVDSQPAQHTWDLGTADIHPASRPRHAFHVRNRGIIIVVVLQINANHLVAFVLGWLEVRDVALFFQNAGNLQLQLGSGDIYFLVPRADRITNSRQHVCDRIGQIHLLTLLKPPVLSATAENQRWLTTLNIPRTHPF